MEFNYSNNKEKPRGNNRELKSWKFKTPFPDRKKVMNPWKNHLNKITREFQTREARQDGKRQTWTMDKGDWIFDVETQKNLHC